MLTETQTLVIECILVGIIVFCVGRLVQILAWHFYERRRYERYAKEFFKKIEEHRNALD